MKSNLGIGKTILLALFLLAVSIAFTGCSGKRDGDINPTPPAKDKGTKGFQFVMGTDYYAPSDASMLLKGKSITDQNFHTKLKRITDKKLDKYLGPGIQNEYAKSDPENSDGTFIILRGNDGGWYLYNALTFKKERNLADVIVDGVEPEPRWDGRDPKIFYYLSQAKLKAYDIEKNTSTTIHNFKKEFPKAAYITTKTEGDASLNRRYWAFMVENSSFELLAVVVYDKKLDKIIGRKDSGFPDEINWVGMDMSGERSFIGYESLTYAQVFSRDFKKRLILPSGSNGHGDLALTADGKDVVVYQNVRTDYIAMADLNTGKETPLVKIPFSINTDIGLHISGNSSETPGWVLVSTYGSKNPPPGKRHSWMDTQLFMLELKGNPRIWRIAHTHSYTSLAFSEEKNYFAEAFAAINSNGTRIYFGSNWGRIVTDYTETYQVILPDDWMRRMPK